MRRTHAGGPEVSAWLGALEAGEPASPVAAWLCGRRVSAEAGRGRPKRTGGGRRVGLSACGNAATAKGGRGAADYRCATIRAPLSDRAAGCADAARREARAGEADAGDRHTRSDGRAGAKLRAAGDEAVRDAGSEDGEAEHRQGREDQRQGVGDGRRIVQDAGELAEDRRADADDHGEHENLHARRDDVAQHLLRQERGAAEKAEGHEDEAGQRRQLELDQADEELDRHDEEADDEDEPRRAAG